MSEAEELGSRGWPSVVDLSDEPGSTRQIEVRKEPYDPARDRESMRAWLAKAVVVVLAVSLLGVAILLAVVLKVDRANAREWAPLLITAFVTPVVGLAGTILGFYFGREK